MAGRRLYQYQQLAFVAPVAAAVAGASFISTEEVLFSAKTFLYQSIAEPVPVPAPSAVTVDSWHRPLSEPSRQFRRQAQQFDAFVPVIAAPVGTGNFVSSEETILSSKSLLYQSIAEPVPTPPPISFSWFAPLPEPVRQKFGLPVAEQQFFTIGLPECPQMSVVDLGTSAGGAVPSYNFTTPAIPAKALICIAVFDTPGITATTVTDTAGNSYKKILTVSASALFYSWNSSALSAGDTITVHKTDAVNASIASAFYATGIQSSFDPHDAAVDAINIDAPTLTPSVLSKTPQKSGELFVAGLTWVEGGTPGFTQSVGWTSPFNPVAAGVVELAGGNRTNPTASVLLYAPTVTVMTGNYAAFITGFASVCNGLAPTPDVWLRPLSEPVRIKPALNSALQQHSASVVAPVTAINAIPPPWSEPVRLKAGLATVHQQALAFVAPIAEVITYDKWGYGLSEPVRSRLGLKAHLQQAAINPAAPPTEAVTEDRWHQPWSEPVRQKSGLKSYLQQAVSFPRAVAARGADQWKPTQLSEPVRARPGLKPSLQQSIAFTELVPTVTVDKWFAGLSEPTRAKRGPPASTQQFYTAPQQVTAEVITVDKWFEPLSDPVKVKRDFRVRPQVAHAIAKQLFLGWNQSWSEPARFKRGLSTALQQAFVATDLTVPTVQLPSWYETWSEPIRLKIGLTAQYQQSLAWDPQPITVTPPTAVGDVIVSEESVFSSRALLYQSIAEPIPLVAAEIVTVDKWFKSFAEPIRLKVGLSVQFQRFIELDPFPRPPAVITVPGPLSEPVRQKRGLGAHEQQFLAFNPQPFVSFGWHAWLSEPVRLKRGLSVSAQQTFTIDLLPRVSFGWFGNLSEPVRLKSGLPTAEQQTVVAFAPQPFVSFSWFETLSEPVRQKIGLRASLQQTFTTDLTVPTVRLPSWFEAWSEPVRFKPGLSARFQQVFATDYTVRAVLQPSWHRALSEPVRFRRFNTALQQTFTTDWKWGVPPPISDLRKFWFDWWSEPVRFKPELKPALQQAFTTDWKWGIPAFQYSFSITETGDVGAFVFISNLPPSYPDIGVIDVPFGDTTDVIVVSSAPVDDVGIAEVSVDDLTIVAVTSGPDMTEVSVTARDGDETIIGVI